MWVLEARTDAEKIWFPIIWEQKKDASNVIDYAINEEITIWNNSFINANNDTTTWEATLVYWVNAPRLLENTSIYQNAQPPYWWCTATWDFRVTVVDWDTTDYVKDWVLTEEYWNVKFKDASTYPTLKWLRIPSSWYYQVDVSSFHGSNTYKIDTEFRISRWWFGNDILIYSLPWEYSSATPSASFKYNFTEWDAIYWYVTLYYSWTSTTFTVQWHLTMTLTKL